MDLCVCFSLSISTSQSPSRADITSAMCRRLIQSLDVLYLYHLYQQLHLKFYSFILFHLYCRSLFQETTNANIAGVVYYISKIRLFILLSKLKHDKISVFIFNGNYIYWHYMKQSYILNQKVVHFCLQICSLNTKV